jgi:leucyl-tRNA synthetase
VDGKVRGRVALPVDASADEAQRIGLADPNVAKFIAGKTPKKVVYVPGKILNFIVS